MNVIAAQSAARRKKMKTFTIDAENNITVFATKKEAAAASATPFDSFTNQDELAELTSEWPAQRLVEIWNGIPGVNAITKFTNRKIATDRIWKAIQSLGAPATEQVSEAACDKPKSEAATEQPTEPPAAPMEAIAETVATSPEETSESAAQAEPEAPVASTEAVASVDAQTPDVAPAETEPSNDATPAKKTPKAKKAPKAAKTESGPREGSKTAQVVAMLQREGGVTLAEIMSTMTWQKHTVRGFMAGAMKKAGYTVESFKPEGGERTYRINK
jgi:hypothetical protein